MAHRKITLILLLALLPWLGEGKNIYVSLSGTNNLPYTNWPDAATNIQWAVNVGTNGDTVWISNGTYVLTNQITVNSNITICGADTNNKPVIDGNYASRCFYVQSGYVTLSNLFITHGYTSGADGGGVRMQYGGTVQNCIFSNNISTNVASETYGGGIYLAASGTVQNCTFFNNSANKGGGLGVMNITTRVFIDGCSFLANTNPVNSGAGLFFQNVKNALITNCNFNGNYTANKGGGIYVYNSAAYTNNIITDCSFSSNTASGDGGGIYLEGEGEFLVRSVLISNNTSLAYSGGGLHCFGSRILVDNCVIARNSTLTGNGGGGIYLRNSASARNCTIKENRSTYDGGGVYMNSNGIVRNCLIINNSARDGGGIYLNNTLGIDTISSGTIASNYASRYGGGVRNGSSCASLVDNCIIYYNACATAAYSNYYDSTTQASYSNCLFAPAMDSSYTRNTNNITADPAFIDWTNANYRLTRDSPGVNRGVNRDWMSGTFDLDGRRRIDLFSGRVDIGCYEFMPNGTMFKSW